VAAHIRLHEVPPRRVLKPLVGVTGRDHVTDEEFEHKLRANYINHETGNYGEEHMRQLPPYRSITRAAQPIYCHVLVTADRVWTGNWIY
jgi:hypothetical protein